MKFLFKLGITLLFALSCLASTGNTLSQPSINNSKPTVIKVGVHLLGIDQPDLYKGTYAMDGHLVFICPSVCPKLKLEIMNGSIVSLEQETTTPSRIVYRIKVALHDNFDARNYPFDSHWLRLEFKDYFLDKSKIEFVADPKLVVIDPKVILHGWEYNFKVKAVSDDRTHPLMNDTSFSKFTFMVELQRPLLMGFLKVIFPAAIIMLFAFIGFYISPKKSINRIGIVSGALLGSILFHINLTSSLPPLGYLTYVDMFMIINYITLFIILFENIFVMRLVEKKKEKLYKKTDKLSMYFLPIFWLILQIINALLFFLR